MKKITIIKLFLLGFWMFIFFECFSQWTTMDPIPTPRSNATASTLEGKIYVIGGITDRMSTALATVEAYDPKTNSWDTTIADLPIPICYASSQVINNTLYVIGGTDRQSSGMISQSMYAYDQSQNTWVKKENLPIKVAFHQTVVVEDTIYVIGGVTNELALSSMYAYDQKNDNWFKKADLPAMRAFHSIQARHKNIYVMGGAYLAIPRNSNYVYSVEDGSWQSSRFLPVPLTHHGSGKLDNEIYVFGGLQNWNPTSTSLKTYKLQQKSDTTYWEDIKADIPEEILGYAYTVALDETGRLAVYLFSGATRAFYNPDGNQTLSSNTYKFAPERNTLWKYMAPMPTPRTLTASAVLDGKVYVIGGVFSRTGMATDIVEAYDIETDTWMTNIDPLPEPVCNATAQIYSDKVYVIGGSDYHLGPGKKSTFEYDPEMNAWTRMSDMDMPLSGHASMSTVGRIRTLGGIGENGMATNIVLEFFPDQNRWEVFSPMNIPRAFCSAVSTLGEIRGTLAMGGLYLGEPVKMMEEFNFLGPWENVGDMPVGRFWHGAGKVDYDTVFIFGGIGEGNEPLFDIAKYNWMTDQWFEVDQVLPEYSSPFASAVVIEGEQVCLYAIGGPTYDFWSGGNGPLVTGLNLKYCMDHETATHVGSSQAPVDQLYQNYPNPFAGVTNIPFELQKAGNVTLEIIAMNGQKEKTIFAGNLDSGIHTIPIEVGSIPNGVYLYQLKTHDGIAVKKLIVQHPE